MPTNFSHKSGNLQLRNNPKAVSRIEKVKWLVIDGNPPEEEVFQNAWEEIISLLQNVKK